MVKRAINTGEVFGDLTIIIETSPNNYLCKCVCGNEIIKNKNYLLYADNYIPSCGCRKGKHTAQLNKIYKRKYCNYDLSNEYGIGFTTNKNTKFLFDKEDYNKIKDFAWHISSEGYILTRDRDTHKIIKLHQLIMGGKYIDHINRDKSDNRKSNLRFSNDLLNSHNRSTPSNNKSGCMGVSFHTKSNKWRATITVNHKHIELGEFKNIEDAIEARNIAELKYFKGSH